MAASEPGPLLLTPGEPAGIGAEIALMAWLRRESAGVPAFALLDDPERVKGLAADLGWDVPVRVIDEPADAEAAMASALPVLAHSFPARITPGHPDPANAGAVIGAIDRAVAHVRAGDAAAVVTNPISKHVLQAGGFAHPGHTEYLAGLAADGGAAPTPVMMLACPALRVVPVTVHVPLRTVPERLTEGAVAHAVRVTHAALIRDFGIAAPRVAVAGLNPHAGEDGTLGREEAEVIGPALDRLRAEGLSLAGPAPADSLFHESARAAYDAGVCMYHDQALIPLKTLDFARGVNVTLGLPFVRTSPDHGTALDRAGTGSADPTSLIESLHTARTMAANRAAASDG